MDQLINVIAIISLTGGIGVSLGFASFGAIVTIPLLIGIVDGPTGGRLESKGGKGGH